MGELCVEGIRREQIMALPSVLNYRVWSLGPRSLPGLANRRGHAAKTRRNLFGPVDHDENLRFAREELDKMTREDSDRWNFDFASENPQEGRYDWAIPGEAAEVDANRASRHTCLTATTNGKKQVKRLQCNGQPAKMKQTLCTDFFRISSAKSRAFGADAKVLDSAKYSRLRVPESASSRFERKDNASLNNREKANGCVEMR